MCGYTCCGHPMQRDGSQIVCRRCGAWIDTGAHAPARIAAR